MRFLRWFDARESSFLTSKFLLASRILIIQQGMQLRAVLDRQIPHPLSNFALKRAFLPFDFLTAPASRKTSPRSTLWPNLSTKGSRIDLEKTAGISNEFENSRFYYDLYHRLGQLCTLKKNTCAYGVKITTYALPSARNVYHDKHFPWVPSWNTATLRKRKISLSNGINLYHCEFKLISHPMLSKASPSWLPKLR